MMMATSRTCKIKYHKYIDDYMNGVRDGTIIAGKDIHMAMDYIEFKLCDKDVFIDSEKIDKAVDLIDRYWGMPLFDWQLS